MKRAPVDSIVSVNPDQTEKQNLPRRAPGMARLDRCSMILTFALVLVLENGDIIQKVSVETN